MGLGGLPESSPPSGFRMHRTTAAAKQIRIHELFQFQSSKFRQHVHPMRPHVYLFVNPPHDALFVNQDGNARSKLCWTIGRAIQYGKVAPRVRDERKIQIEIASEGQLSMPAFGAINRHAPNFSVQSSKVRSLITER